MFSFLSGPKMDRAGEGIDGGGAGSTTLINPENIRVDMGIPHELGVEDEPEPAKPKVDPNEARFKGIETELAATRRQLAEARASERFWAGKASATPTEEPAGAVEHVAADPYAGEKPEAFLDDLGKRGAAALKDRGYVSKAEAEAMVNEGVAEANQNLHVARTDATFDQQLAAEFPDIAADGRRIANGGEPQTELYKRSAVIFRQTVKLDPSLQNSKSALIMAARTAAAEIKAEAKATKASAAAAGTPDSDLDVDDTRSARRRDRIAAQASDRGGSVEGDDSPTVGLMAKEVMRHLKVPEAEFLKNRDGGRRGR